MRCVKITRGKVIHNLDVRWIVFVEQMNAGTELCDCFLKNVMKGVQMFIDGYYMCTQTKEVIPSYYLCDGISTCTYADDELACDGIYDLFKINVTSSLHFMCLDGESVAFSLVNNNIADCQNNEDETTFPTSKQPKINLSEIPNTCAIYWAIM